MRSRRAATRRSSRSASRSPPRFPCHDPLGGIDHDAVVVEIADLVNVEPHPRRLPVRNDEEERQRTLSVPRVKPLEHHGRSRRLLRLRPPSISDLRRTIPAPRTLPLPAHPGGFERLGAFSDVLETDDPGPPERPELEVTNSVETPLAAPTPDWRTFASTMSPAATISSASIVICRHGARKPRVYSATAAVPTYVPASGNSGRSTKATC